MGLGTWNRARGPLARKLTALDELQPDVAILCEAPTPPDASDDVLWFPTGEGRSNLGIQVRAYGEYRLRAHARVPNLPTCVNPVRVIGPAKFNLLAVWTWAAPTYLSALAGGIEAYAGLFAEPTVVAGDFNGNPTADRPRQRATWSNAFARINELGSVSAYHHVEGVSYGDEVTATHHHRRDPNSRFHIDFCFVPKLWCTDNLRVKILGGSPWTSLSDHFPVVVDAPIGQGHVDDA